jgi:hypothetical protein
MPSEDLDRPCTVPRHVVVRPFNDDAIALNMQKGTFHELNRTAADMFERLRTATIPREIVPDLVEQYDAPEETIAADLATLVGTLRERGILE